MRQADGCNTVRLFQVEAHEALGRIPLPIRQPSEDQQARAFNAPILADHAERPPAHADASHHPSTAGAQVGLHVRGLEPPLGTPPFHSLVGIGQRLEDAFRRSLNGGISWTIASLATVVLMIPPRRSA